MSEARGSEVLSVRAEYRAGEVYAAAIISRISPNPGTGNWGWTLRMWILRLSAWVCDLEQ